MRTGVLSDEAWARIEPLLPSSAGKRGGRWRDHRQVFEAIAWRFRTGTPWRDLPEEFGPFQTIWCRHDLWSRDGTYDLLLTALQVDSDAAGELNWLSSVDSTVVRAHQHAAGARRAADPSPERPVEADQPAGRGEPDVGVDVVQDRAGSAPVLTGG